MEKLLLIARAISTDRLRWAKAHLYTSLILSPIVLGMAYATASGLATDLPDFNLSWEVRALASISFVVCLLGLSLSRTAAEIYSVRRPESFLDVLPVAPRTRFHVALSRRAGRTLISGFLAVVVRWLLNGRARIDIAPALLLFVVLTSLGEVLAALNWIHLSHTGERSRGIGSLTALIVTAVISGLTLLVVADPGEAQYLSPKTLFAFAFPWAVALYWLTWHLYEIWHARDIEFAKRLQQSGRLRFFNTRTFGRLFGSAVGAMLSRDIRLTLRGFSSAVYVVLVMGGLLLSVLFVVLRSDLLPPSPDHVSATSATWLPEVVAVKITTVLVTASVGSLLCVLVSFQLPYLFLERSVGASGPDLWTAKLWYARLITMPAPVVAWLIATACGHVPLFYVLPLLAECVWVWWLVSTLYGSLSYEIPDRPGLAIILMSISAGGVGLLIALLWPVGVAVYAFGLRALLERGHARARYCLVAEEF